MLISCKDNSSVEDNTIFWQKDNTDLKSGWNLVGLDLSKYKGVRIEFEKNDLNLELTLTDKNWQNWAAFRSEDPYSIEAYFPEKEPPGNGTVLHPATHKKAFFYS